MNTIASHAVGALGILLVLFAIVAAAAAKSDIQFILSALNIIGALLCAIFVRLGAIGRAQG